MVRIKNNSGRIISGTPIQVKKQLLQLADDFNIDEIIVATMTGSVEDRKRSFALLAETFDLKMDEIAWFKSSPSINSQQYQFLS